MKSIKFLLIVTALLAGAVHAQPATGGAVTTQIATSPSEMTEAEVRKVDRENQKITLKHGAIKNLEMPPMTMVFRVSDTAMLDKVQAGDKVRFTAAKDGGKLTVTALVPEK